MQELEPGKYKVVEDRDDQGLESGTYVFVIEVGSKLVVRIGRFALCRPDFIPDWTISGAQTTTP